MPRYRKQGDTKGKKVIPSVTEIISDCTNSSGPLTQWAANMCKEWIVENANFTGNSGVYYEIDYYRITEKELDEMRFNFRKVSQKALDIGSTVHGLIEEYLNLCMTEGDFDYKEWMLSELNYGPEVFNAFNAFLDWESKHKLKPIALEQTVYINIDGYEIGGTLDYKGYFNDKIFIIDWKSSAGFYPEMRIQTAAYRSIHEDAEGNGVLRLDKSTGQPSWHDCSKSYEKDLEIFKTMARLYMMRHPKIAKGCFNG